jgi:hypothetical protein
VLLPLVKPLLTDNDTIDRHVFTGDLQPPTGRRTKIYAASSSLEERVFFVELYELERRTCAVALLSAETVERDLPPANDLDLLCKLIVLVKTILPGLFLRLSHWISERGSALTSFSVED